VYWDVESGLCVFNNLTVVVDFVPDAVHTFCEELMNTVLTTRNLAVVKICTLLTNPL